MPVNYAKVSVHVVCFMWTPMNGNYSLDPKMRWIPCVVFKIGTQALISLGKPTVFWIVLFSAYYRITESQNSRGWKGPLWVI